MKNALVLREIDIQSALRNASKIPWLALGFESSAPMDLVGTEPAWVPKPGVKIPSKDGSYTVISAHRLLPGFEWPWLLCSKQTRGRFPEPPALAERPSRFERLGSFANLCFVSSALLCWRDGHSRVTVNEKGETLRLVPPSTLAKAISRHGAPVRESVSARLRSSRDRARPAPEISPELAELLRR